jgi:hypothetical protein
VRAGPGLPGAGLALPAPSRDAARIVIIATGHHWRVLLPALSLLLLAGCDHVPQDAVESCNPDIRIAPARTDILVVVDDSKSMSEEQENLRRNMALFAGALAAGPIQHDFQIGVTTTSVANTNAMSDEYPRDTEPYQSAYPDWAVPFPKGTLVAVDAAARTDLARRGLFLYDPALGGFHGDRILPSDSASLVPDLEANVLVGIQGSHKEEPLLAARLALTDRVVDGTNRSFLRSGARLGVIILTDEDDCSETGDTLYATDDTCDKVKYADELLRTSDFVDFLEGPIDGEQRDPIVAVIAGFDQRTHQPTGCDSSFDAPTRLAALLDALGPERSFRGSICDASFGPALQQIADLLVPQRVPLDGAPADAHMLLVWLHKVGGASVECPVAAEGESTARTGAVYAPPRAGWPATLTFQGACRLEPGDRIELQMVCAG